MGTLLLLPGLGMPVSAGEDPEYMRCAELAGVTYLCVSMDVSVPVECVNHAADTVVCEYTYGWNLLAYSPAMVPGSSEFEWAFEVEVCVDGQPCEIREAGGGGQHCSWLLPLDECQTAESTEHVVSVVLEPGQCVTTRSYVKVSAKARAMDPGPTISQIAAGIGKSGHDTACSLDDGR